MAKNDKKVVSKIEDDNKELKKKKDKCLYICESILNSYEYKIASKYFPQNYWAFVIQKTIFNLIVTLIISLCNDTYVTLVFLVAMQILIMIVCKVRLEDFSEKIFEQRLKNGVVDTETHIEFYDDYFLRIGELQILKIKYSDIIRCIETDTNIYLDYRKMNTIIFIQKKSCDEELINYIKDKFKNLENNNKKAKKKPIKLFSDPNYIYNFMTLLFLFTFFSIGLATWTMTLINPRHIISFLDDSWVFFCYLPIPILSIILGFKYQKQGIKCIKNIIGGFVVFYLLIAIGGFSLVNFPEYSEDYSIIDDYREIVDAEIPNNGRLEILNDWDAFLSEEDKKDYSIIYAYYKDEDVTDLVNSIENNNNWILSTEIKSELRMLIPSQLKSGDNVYFSVYNKTTNQYNIVPDVAGDYEVYAMKYDGPDKRLEIHKFNYSYR